MKYLYTPSHLIVPIMEMIEKFGEKIHVEKDVHQIMILYEHIEIIRLENYLLYYCNLSIYMDTNKYNIDYI